MKKIIWITSIFILGMVFVLPALLALGIRVIPADVQPPLNKTRDIYGLFTVTQEFTSLRPNMTSIGLSIKNPNLKNRKDVTLDLFDSEGRKIRSATLNGLNIDDGAFVKFTFDPITDSQNRKFTFTISAPFAGPEDLLAAYYADKKPSWIGQLKFDKEEVGGGLSMVTFHKSIGKIEVIKEIYSNLFSRLLLHRYQKSL